MRISPALFLAVVAACVVLCRARAEDVTKIDPAARVDKLAPGPDTTKAVEKIDLKRDDRVQDNRATLAGLIEEPTAPLASRRAAIDVAETREKNIIARKDAPVSTDVLPRKDSALAGQVARDSFQPTGNASRNNGRVAEKYQQGIRAANAASVQLQPDLDRQSTFDQLNRFVFRRNGPGTEGGSALVTAAGGGAATVLPTAADTTTAAAGNSSGSGGDNIAPMGIIAPPNRPPSAKAVEWWGRQSNGAQMVPPASAP